MEIACIVEGDGEQQALPLLITRIIGELYPGIYIRVFAAKNFRGRDKFQDMREVQRAVDNAARRVGPGGAILILRDADDDCPVAEAERLRRWAHAVRSDVHISVVIAKREYEAWFLAAAESLRGHRGLQSDLASPPNPESVRGVKEWLTRHMQRGQPYAPTRLQASFSDRMDLELARRNSRSFRKLYGDVQRLAEALRAAQS